MQRILLDWVFCDLINISPRYEQYKMLRLIGSIVHPCNDCRKNVEYRWDDNSQKEAEIFAEKLVVIEFPGLEAGCCRRS
jgi:hypothetical protein